MKKVNLLVDYEKQLNPEQLRAVTHREGPLLVIAGAGSGKTRTLVYRVAYLVEKGVDARNILLLTFTRKAAQEMLRRASSVLDDRCSHVAGGTYHSFANNILRKNAKKVGYEPGFTILDRSDSEDLINLLRSEMGLSGKEARFPKKETLGDIFSKSSNCLSEIPQIVEKQYPQFYHLCQDIELLRDRYEENKKTGGLMDYDDLLVKLKMLLEENPSTRKKLGEFYKYIMVDEYQDTNKIQSQITALLASEHQNVMAVGDDSQSIYSFRGANFKNIMDFPRIFPGTEVVTIEENYRSTQNILNLTNEVIKFASEKYSKNLRTNIRGGRKPLYVEARDENEQSRYVCKKLLELREEGVKLNDMAVLFRAGWHSNDLELELRKFGIPFKKYGGVKFTEASHIKDVLSILKSLVNPRDSVSWFRSLKLIEGVGSKTAKLFFERISQKGGIENLQESLYASKIYKDDINQLKKLSKLLNENSVSAEEIVSEVLEYYRDKFLRIYLEDYSRRANDLDSLVFVARRYSTVAEFLTDMTLEPLEKSQIDTIAGKDDDEILTLSTVHSAKGLEWHSVFIIHLTDGYFPSYRCLEDPDDLEEERRLLYVATTRAKRDLFLLKPGYINPARNYWNFSLFSTSQVSRFLAEGRILTDFVEREYTDE
ncbi:ATP-dependent helicase [candidate division WOR-3 bacterium]|nr:ATP-dependent helicase [candidate division WOR-3 bacterium]